VTDHPYWAYVAVPGSIDEAGYSAAVDEGRRAFALEMAVEASSSASQAIIIARAQSFEEYLKGELARDESGAPL
jgi:hypothetical protein